MEFADTPTNRLSVMDMTDDQLEQFVTELQERRMKARRDYEVAQALKAKRMLETTRTKLDHMLGMLDKDFASIDKALSKITERMIKIRVVRREIDAHAVEAMLDKDTIHEIESRT